MQNVQCLIMKLCMESMLVFPCNTRQNIIIKIMNLFKITINKVHLSVWV